MKQIFLILILAILSMTSCWKSKWTEEERNEFKKNCNKVVTFDVSPISFEGFDYQDTVTIIVRHNNVVLDTLYTRMSVSQDRFDEDNNKYWSTTSPQLTFNINNEYDFYIGEEQPYVLSKMEMIMWAQYTQMSEGWGCVMGNYNVNELEYEHSGNIKFIRRK